MKRIAVFLPNWIGDVVMATPAINALWEGLARGSLVAVGRPYVRAVIDGSPWFDDFVDADPNHWWATAKTLKSMKCASAVLFPNSFRSGLIAWLAGIPKRVGYARNGRNLMLTDAVQAIRDRRGKFVPSPVMDSYNRLAARLGVTPGHRMRLFTMAADEAAADRVWKQLRLSRHREVVALNPGAAFGAAKFWPVEHFAELARQLIDRRESGVLVLCGPNERELARQIVVTANRPGVVSLAEFEPSIGLTKAAVRRCDLLVTTDSGPRHFAAAFGRPVVTLYGPTHQEWTTTYFAAEINLQKTVPCGPCQQRVCHLDHRCMTTLLPGEVFAAAARLLSGLREVRHVG